MDANLDQEITDQEIKRAMVYIPKYFEYLIENVYRLCSVNGMRRNIAYIIQQVAENAYEEAAADAYAQGYEDGQASMEEVIASSSIMGDWELGQ